jgi:threonine dehydratase
LFLIKHCQMINKIPDKKDIIEAYERIKPFINKTPVLTSSTLNKIFNTELYFKCENFQKAGAFKFRGAANAVFSMSDEEIKNGVATHSSGNFAQALSLAAKIRNVKAYIVMPSNSSKVKINAVKNYGGEIIFCEPTLAARESTLEEVVKKTKAVFIHPYDDYKIIAGQGTACYELINEVNELDIISAPVGGGGLISGTALSAHYFSPKTKVIACEPELANDAWQSMKAGKIIPSVNPNTIADGLRTSLGEKTFPIIQKYVDEIVTVSERAIIEAMKLVWERMKIIIEPSSSVCIAALLENKYDYKNKRIGIIFSGGNVDLSDLPW